MAVTTSCHVLAGVITGRVEVLWPQVSPRWTYIRGFPLGQGCLDPSHLKQLN